MRYSKLLFLPLFLVILAGCSGVKTYPAMARAGDTVAIAAGWKQHFSRNEIVVTITDANGITTTYLPGDPAVRAVVNLYPDPVSSIIISEETNQDLTPYAQIYSSSVNTNITSDDKDWWQTSVFIDLPSTMATGSASINIGSVSSETSSTTLEIIGGTGTVENFQTEFGPLNPDQLASMERVGHYIISFTGSVIPYGIQVELSHLPDVNNGGAGKVYVVNTRGDLKNINWVDDGASTLKVLLTPSQPKVLDNMKDFKFYVAGGIDGLIVNNVIAVDVNGNPVSGVVASIATNN